MYNFKFASRWNWGKERKKEKVRLAGNVLRNLFRERVYQVSRIRPSREMWKISLGRTVKGNEISKTRTMLGPWNEQVSGETLAPSVSLSRRKLLNRIEVAFYQRLVTAMSQRCFRYNPSLRRSDLAPPLRSRCDWNGLIRVWDAPWSTEIGRSCFRLSEFPV